MADPHEYIISSLVLSKIVPNLTSFLLKQQGSFNSVSQVMHTNRLDESSLIS